MSVQNPLGSAIVQASDAPTPDMVRPPYDPIIEQELLTSPIPHIMTKDEMRNSTSAVHPEGNADFFPGFVHTEYATPPPSGSKEESLLLSAFVPRETYHGKRPCVYHIHGGGQIAGNRFSALETALGYFNGTGAVVVSVEYCLAPEHPAPAALEDCYAGLVWVAKNTEELGVDADKILVFGVSGGGPLAASSVIMARDRRYPPVYAQMLLTPMLEDREITVSSKQFYDKGIWCGKMNNMAWDMVLGARRGTPDLDVLCAPARAVDLSNLPRAFIDAGECEVFRDEAVAYASKMWECGSSAELHIWPGAYHGFDMLGSKAPVAAAAQAAKVAWVRRMFKYTEPKANSV